MYFQTGSIVGRSLTQDGDPNRGKVPIQELQTSSANGKISSLINTYQYYLQMIRDVTGLNEARDGSMPDKDSLVGLQKMAANASNTATKHILNAMMYLTVRTCENISLRVSDMLDFELTSDSLKASIGKFNVATLKEIDNLHLYDFGVFLDLEPEEEEKAQLEQNIQMALQQNQIYLEDAIDIREIKNLTLANQVLKYKRIKKQQADQEAQMANIQAQTQSNSEAAEKAAMADVQKAQALNETNVQFERAKSDFEIQRMQTAAQIEQEQMAQQFEYDMKLKEAELSNQKAKEKEIEDRKDNRTKLQATQQSKMIDQRKNNSLPIDFEDDSGLNLEQFM
tara:strand:- start:184 stop:1197 length:1014 start_codon:yes stop_codon:yes gene_type:complete